MPFCEYPRMSWLTEAAKHEPLAAALPEVRSSDAPHSAVGVLIDHGEPLQVLLATEEKLVNGEGGPLLPILWEGEESLPVEAKPILISAQFQKQYAKRHDKFAGSTSVGSKVLKDNRYLAAEFSWFAPRALQQKKDDEELNPAPPSANSFQGPDISILYEGWNDAVRLSSDVRLWT